MSSLYSFGPFVLEPANRRLSANGRPVELSGRYLDALVLLVVEEGRLVTKARLLDEVWKGVPVTEEALTQCVRSLRKALGDEAGRPRFIETVPRHGYRFIASVTAAETAEANSDAARFEPRPRRDRRQALSHFLGLGRAGLIGGGGAGLVGGLAYGFAGVAQSGAGGALSGLVVLAALTAVIGMIGGSSVGFGVGAAAFASRYRGAWQALGGACGGMLIGGLVRLAGLDAFALLFGSAPSTMTGAGEGMALGAAIGVGVWITQAQPRRTALMTGALVTGGAGAGATLLGGRLMGGSLAALEAQFPGARLELGHLGALFGEPTFGAISQAVTAGLEGALFGAAMVLALRLEQQHQVRDAVPCR